MNYPNKNLTSYIHKVTILHKYKLHWHITSFQNENNYIKEIYVNFTKVSTYNINSDKCCSEQPPKEI